VDLTFFRSGAIAAWALVCLNGCYESDGGSNTDLEVNCLDVACPWQTDQGTAKFGATWHDGDLGVDLSAPGGTNAVSMKVVMIARNSRQFEIDAAIFRDPSAQLHVDFDFYAPGSGAGDTFWDRGPVLLSTETVPAESVGSYVLHRHVNVPSESAAFVIHLVREGDGRAFVDELSVGHIDYVRTL
jgi:hypothetical protein